jgi:hypothetical protein
MTPSSDVIPNQEEIVSVVVILLMFLAVIAMVKRVDDDRQPRKILAPDSRILRKRLLQAPRQNG